MIPQISVLVANKPGQLRRVTGIINDNNISFLAISTYDATDFGVFHLIVDKPQLLMEVLTKAGYNVLERSTIAVVMEDEVGYMNKVLDELSKANINVDCLYTFVSKAFLKPVLLFRTEEPDETEMVLRSKGFTVVSTLDELTK